MSSLLVDREAPVVRITINRPNLRNAANLEVWRRIGEEVIRAGSEPGVRAIVITGAGDKAFMAGADVSEFPAILQDRDRIAGYVETVVNTCSAIEEADVPVIAMINGHAIGGGLEMACACDYRIAVEGARFGIPSAAVGLAIVYRDIERIVGLVGSARARELLIFGHQYGASEALAMGLINEVVPPERLEERTQELVSAVAAKAPLSVRSAKRVINSIVHGRFPAGDETFAVAMRSVQEAWESEEFRRRVDSMVNKG